MASDIFVRGVSTGKVHRGTKGTGSTWCNYMGQRRPPRCVPISDATVYATDERAFCRKCFPSGKPMKPAE